MPRLGTMTDMRIPVLLVCLALALTGCTTGQGPGGSADPAGSSPTAGAVPGVDATEGIRSVADFREQARDLVAAMDDAALTGAVVVGSYEGTDPAAGVSMVEDNQLAGAIVMAYNLPEAPSPEDVRQVTEALAGAGPDRGRPVFLGVDQEGGPVSRLATAALDLPPLMAHGAADDPELTTAVTHAQGADLRNLGFTADFAPVADVTIGARDAAINVRSPGSDPALVSRIAQAAVQGYTDAGLASSAKHFPGHGALTEDSHETLPVSDATIEEMSDRDLQPFRAAAQAGVPMIMVGHIGLPGAEDTPATVNPDAYDALREMLDYDGVVVTDAMNMGAVTSGAAGAETVEAIRAGADLVLLPPNAAASVTALRQALGAGEIDRERLAEAAERVVAMQLWQEHAAGLAVDDSGVDDTRVDDSGVVGADERIDALADRALTVIAGECEFAEPVDAVAVAGEDDAVAAFTTAAEEAGLRIEEAAETSVAVGRDPTTDTTGETTADVVYGTGGPWRLADSTADTVLAGYDDYAAGYGALARYLTGEISADGTLPVELDEVDAPDCS